MLEIRAWQGENNTTATKVAVEGSSLNDLLYEFIFGTTKALKSIGEHVEKDLGKEAAEKLKITLMASMIAQFVADCTDHIEDEEFFESMADCAVEFLEINIAMKKPGAEEIMGSLLESIFDEIKDAKVVWIGKPDGEKEQEQSGPDGDPDGEE